MPTIYDVGLIFVCSPYARILQKRRERNPGKYYVFFSEVTAAQDEACDRRRLGLPTPESGLAVQLAVQ